MQAENIRVAEEERRKTLVEETKHARAVRIYKKNYEKMARLKISYLSLFFDRTIVKQLEFSFILV
jgi:hypothetical protein